MSARQIASTVVAMTLLAGAAEYFYWIYSPPARLPELTARIELNAVDVDGQSRTFENYVPAKLPANAPLVIVLHGSFMDGAQMRRDTGYEFDQLADEHGFAVVYPDGYEGNWNDCRNKATYAAATKHINDLGFLHSLVAKMAAAHGIDQQRVFAVGYSNGGHMAFKLATEGRDWVAAVAAIGANLPVAEDSSCSPAGPTARTMLVSGTADPLNPFNGGLVSVFGLGKRGSVLSATASAEAIARRNGVLAPPASSTLLHHIDDDPTRVRRVTWGNDSRPTVALYAVEGGGHVVPQARFRFPRILGRTTGDLDAPRSAIQFFGL